jgi:ribosomal protein S27E
MFHIIAAISSVFHLTRTCLRCGRKQIVHRSESTKTVKCKFCGVDIPPKRRQW